MTDRTPLTDLAGPAWEQLHNALLEAFDRGSLERLVRIYLEEDLFDVAGGDSLEDLTSSLLNWATRKGRLNELVEGAFEENPGNVLLLRFKQEVWEKHGDPIGAGTDKPLEPPFKQEVWEKHGDPIGPGTDKPPEPPWWKQVFPTRARLTVGLGVLATVLGTAATVLGVVTGIIDLSDWIKQRQQDPTLLPTPGTVVPTRVELSNAVVINPNISYREFIVAQFKLEGDLEIGNEEIQKALRDQGIQLALKNHELDMSGLEIKINMTFYGLKGTTFLVEWTIKNASTNQPVPENHLVIQPGKPYGAFVKEHNGPEPHTPSMWVGRPTEVGCYFVYFELFDDKPPGQRVSLAVACSEVFPIDRNVSECPKPIGCN